MLKDDKAVSPVVGEILMIVVVIIMAGLLMAFAAEILQSSKEVSSINILIEGAKIGSSSLNVVHMGGDTIYDAFAPSSEYRLNESVYNILEIRINGALYEGNASQNSHEISKPDFEVGDEIVLMLDQPLVSGDSISIIFVPSGQVLRWTVVV